MQNTTEHICILYKISFFSMFSSCATISANIWMRLTKKKLLWKYAPTKAVVFCQIWTWNVSSLIIPSISYLIPLSLSFPACPIIRNLSFFFMIEKLLVLPPFIHVLL